MLLHRKLCDAYSTAVIDVNVTAIGGENAEGGAARFERDVLPLRPDVVVLDYCLNDRGLGLERAERAWRTMIEACLPTGTSVVLLTATPDARTDILDDASPLAQHCELVRGLAREYGLALVDPYTAFRQRVAAGDDVHAFLSQSNHPNEAGHEVVANLLFDWISTPAHKPEAGRALR